MCPSAPRVCSEPGGQRPVLSLSLDLIGQGLKMIMVYMGIYKQLYNCRLTWKWQATTVKNNRQFSNFLYSVVRLNGFMILKKSISQFWWKSEGPILQSLDISWSIQHSTVYPKKYAHGFCFAVLCCGYTLTDFPISIRLTSLALWQSNDCTSASKATLMNMDKYFMWIHYERLHNHNKAKHNKIVCIFLGIYCIGYNTTQIHLC